MAKTEVVNLSSISGTDGDFVFIGRPSKWGNPYHIGRDGDREEVIRKYKQHVTHRPDLMNALIELRGKRLACYCHPKRCHGDVLLDLIQTKFGKDA